MRWRTGLSVLLLVVASTLPCPAQELPITGLAHVGFKVSNVAQATKFYSGILGCEQAFSLRKDDGSLLLAYFKINDDQYIEIFPGLKEGENERLTHVAFVTSDIVKLHTMLEARGLKPSAIQTGRDRNRNFGLKDPDGNQLEFVQYMPGSLHWNARGKAMDERRVSTHMLHAGIMIRNEQDALAFYRAKLGFTEFWRGGPRDGEIRWINLRTPGANGDYVELMLHGDAPSRSELGSMQHIALEVPSIEKAYRTVRQRGVPDEARYKPRLGRNRKRQLNLFDPDGSRTELMEPKPIPGETP